MLKKKNEIDFTEGKFIKKIFLYAIPIILTGLFQASFSIVDMIMVGNFISAEAFAAIGSTSSLINLVIQLFMGLSAGVSIVVSRCFGAKDNEGMSKTSHTAVTLSLIGGICLMCLGLVLTEPLLRLMDSPKDLFHFSALYIKIYFLGMPVNVLYNFSVGIMRAYGDSRRSLYYLVYAGFLNVALNYLFIAVFKWGVAGVATATVIANTLSCSLAVRNLLNLENACRISIKKLKIHKKYLLLILRYGIPTGIQSMLFNLSGVFTQTAVNSFDTAVIAAKGATVYIDNIMSNVNAGFSQTAVTICAQNMGAKCKARIKKGWLMCLFFGTIISFVISAGIRIFSDSYIGIFTRDTAVVEAGVYILSTYVLMYFLSTILNISASGLRGIGYTFTPMVVSLTGNCAFRIVWLLTIFKAYPTIGNLYSSLIIGWIITAIAQTSLFWIFFKRLRFD